MWSKMIEEKQVSTSRIPRKGLKKMWMTAVRREFSVF